MINTDNELIWEQYILERKDVDKINRAKKIYDTYFLKLVRVVSDFFDDFKLPEGEEERVFPKNSNIFHLNFSMLDSNYRDDLIILFEPNKFSKSGNQVAGSYNSDTNSIKIFDNELKDLVKDIQQTLRDIMWWKVRDFDEYVMSDLKSLFGNFFGKLRDYASIIIHELIHYFDADYTNIQNKAQQLHSVKDSKDEYLDKYFNSFWEVNAYTLERIFEYGHVDSIEEFLNAVNREDIDWMNKLNEKNRRKVLKRVYDYYKNRESDIL